MNLKTRACRSASLASILLLAGAASGQGDVVWRFDFATAFSGAHVSVSPDGTVFGNDNLRLYALGPGGSVRWSTDGVGGFNGVSTLADGTLVTGLGETVYGLEPDDGAVRWTFSYDSNGLTEQIEVGPTVGPDGNIYGVTSVGDGAGLGAFSLSPAGDLLWSDPGSPTLDRVTIGTGWPVLFTTSRMVFPFEFVAAGSNAVYAYGLDGRQTQYVDFTCTSYPRVDPQNRIILGGGCGYQAVDTDSDTVYWTVELGNSSVGAAVGGNDRVYGASAFGDLTAISPEGDIVWQSAEASSVVGVLLADDSIGQVVYVEGGFGRPSAVAAASTADGSRLWRRELRTVNGHNELVFGPFAKLSPDGSVVYFSTRFTSNGENGALWAVSTGAGGADGCNAADVAEPFGVLDLADVQTFIAAFTTQDAAADIAPPMGVLDLADVQAFIAGFNAGCP